MDEDGDGDGVEDNLRETLDGLDDVDEDMEDIVDTIVEMGDVAGEDVLGEDLREVVAGKECVGENATRGRDVMQRANPMRSARLVGKVKKKGANVVNRKGARREKRNECDDGSGLPEVQAGGEICEVAREEREVGVDKDHERTIIQKVKEVLKSSKSWTSKIAEEILEILRDVNDSDLLREAISLLPKRMPLRGKRTFDGFVENWLRYQIPNDLFAPMHVERDTNSFFRAASCALYNTEEHWPTLRLCCAKYGMENIHKVILKVSALDVVPVNVSKEEWLVKSILDTLHDSKCASKIHLILLSEAMNMEVVCHSAIPAYCLKITRDFPSEAIHLMWTVSAEGSLTDHVCPLIVKERPSNIKRCAANPRCATDTLALVDKDNFVKCTHCLRFFHVICMGLGSRDIVDTDGTWCCGCHLYASISLEQTACKESIDDFVTSNRVAIQRRFKDILKGNVFSWHLQHILDNRTNLLVHANSEENWFFDGVALKDVFLKHVSSICSSLRSMNLKDLDERILLHERVFLVQLAAMMIQKLESIPLVTALRILSSKHRLDL